MSQLYSNEIKILDKGYVKYIGHMGCDESFVEAARMSTGKGFFGWFWDEDTYSNCICAVCKTHNLIETLPMDEDGCSICNNCWTIDIRLFDEDEDWKEVGCPEPKLLGRKGQPRDLALLNTLYANKHQTPFEMGELCIEVKAPIVVFREWHRHRTQSYNEFSARYSQMPNEHYLPDRSRIQLQSKTNKQGSAGTAEGAMANQIICELERQQEDIYGTYDAWVGNGIAKEIARLNTPVSRYSKMRAKTDIRNWLAFMALRMEMGAQWEIRQYAHAVAEIVHHLFPKTYELFLEYDLMGVRFSRTEMRILRKLLAHTNGYAALEDAQLLATLTDSNPGREFKGLVKKLTEDREELYKDAIKGRSLS
jgi:thymidylate synthase (FAD)